MFVVFARSLIVGEQRAKTDARHLAAGAAP
jgi:hypothetical protein